MVSQNSLGFSAKKIGLTEAAATKRARAAMVFMVRVWTTQKAVTMQIDSDLFIPTSPFANRDRTCEGMLIETNQ